MNMSMPANDAEADNTGWPFEIRLSNGRLNIRHSDVCSRLTPVDARNLIAALQRTINSKHLQIGQSLPLTTSEIELQNFSEFVNFKFRVVDETGTKQSFAQIHKTQVPALISHLHAHLESRVAAGDIR
jgi:hypothetical protein